MSRGRGRGDILFPFLKNTDITFTADFQRTMNVSGASWGTDVAKGTQSRVSGEQAVGDFLKVQLAVGKVLLKPTSETPFLLFSLLCFGPKWAWPRAERDHVCQPPGQNDCGPLAKNRTSPDLVPQKLRSRGLAQERPCSLSVPSPQIEAI